MAESTMTDVSACAPHAPLAHALPAADAASANPATALSVQDRGTPGLVLLRGRGPLAAAVQSAAGLALPDRLQSTQTDDRVLRWQSPDQFLLSCPLDEATSLAEAIESAATGTVAAIDVSGGYLVLELGGDALDTVLRRSTGFDVHPDEFTAGKVVGTTFAKATVTLRRLDDGRVELIARRSFADYLWTWLQRASRDTGIVVIPCD